MAVSLEVLCRDHHLHLDRDRVVAAVFSPAMSYACLGFTLHFPIRPTKHLRGLLSSFTHSSI